LYTGKNGRRWMGGAKKENKKGRAAKSDKLFSGFCAVS
jgi:hypothetical protein